jgi:hypothetical protein
VPNDAAARVKVRLVVQELESWYLGDLDAVITAGLLTPQHADSIRRKAKFRNPDRLTNAKQMFEQIVGRQGQIELARTIGPHLSLQDNRSRSFCNFINALRWAAE